MRSLAGRFAQGQGKGKSKGSRPATVLATSALVIAATSAFAPTPAPTPAPAPTPTPAATHPLAWGSPSLIDKLSLSGLQSLSCSSPKFCAAVDAAGNAFTFNGVSWKSFSDIDSNSGGLWSVACASATFCMASDQDGFATQWNGRRWSPPRQFDFDIDQPSLPRLSCVSATFCAAVDEFGLALVWHGRNWSHRLIATSTGSVDLQGLSCLSPKFCLAVGTGFTTTWNGTTWSKPRAVDNGGGLLAVSCTSTTFCVAVGDGVLNYNGRRWTKTLITGALVNSVSCVTANDCFVVDGTGTLYHWAGGRWTTGPDPIVSNVFLSCKTTSFCAGAATNDDGLFYAPVPAITTASLPSGHKGTAYSARLRASGGTAPYRFKALAGLPRGLRVAPSGVVSGTPKARGRFSVKVAVTDPLGERSTRRLKIIVS